MAADSSSSDRRTRRSCRSQQKDAELMTDTWQSRFRSAEIITPSNRTWSQAGTVSVPGCIDGPWPWSWDMLCLDPVQSNSVLSVFSLSLLADIQRPTSTMHSLSEWLPWWCLHGSNAGTTACHRQTSEEWHSSVFFEALFTQFVFTDDSEMLGSWVPYDEWVPASCCLSMSSSTSVDLQQCWWTGSITCGPSEMGLYCRQFVTIHNFFST